MTVPSVVASLYICVRMYEVVTIEENPSIMYVKWNIQWCILHELVDVKLSASNSW